MLYLRGGPHFLSKGPSMNSIDKYAEELDMRMWKTKGSRYNAYRRYERKHWFSLASISMLTLYVFGLTLADFCHIIEPTANQKIIIPFISMVLSIAILILSLLEASKNYQIKSERLHNCAKEITNLYNELRKLICTDISDVDKSNRLDEITKRYDDIIIKYAENHDPIDYELFLGEHSKEFNIGWFKKQWIFLKSLILAYWLYILLIISPPIILYIMFTK